MELATEKAAVEVVEKVTEKRRRRRHWPLLVLVFVVVTILLVAFGLARQRSVDVSSPFEVKSLLAPSWQPLSPDQVSYTLVTQLSDDRLWMMEHHCRRWSHPMSIAVLSNRTLADVEVDLAGMGCTLAHLAVQVYSRHSMDDYPVNLLRNRALSAVQTSHVVYLDSDFWPSVDLYETLQQEKIRQHLADDEKAALVVPAFQLQRQCPETVDCSAQNIPLMPYNQAELFQVMLKHKAYRFDPTNKGGHGSTNYKAWLTQSAEDLVPIDCALSNRYEPYLVFRYFRDLPPFPERFSGYGKNKMAWIMLLRRMGWAFWQVGESFVIHYPHRTSPSRLKWNGGDKGEQIGRPDDHDLANFQRAQTDQLFVEFREWLHNDVPDQTRIHRCKNAEDDDSRLWVPTVSSGARDLDSEE